MFWNRVGGVSMLWESASCFRTEAAFFLESLGQFKVFCECALDFFVVFFDIIGEVFFVQLLLFCCYQLNFSAISSRCALNCR